MNSGNFSCCNNHELYRLYSLYPPPPPSHSPATADQTSTERWLQQQDEGEEEQDDLGETPQYFLERPETAELFRDSPDPSEFGPARTDDEGNFITGDLNFELCSYELSNEEDWSYDDDDEEDEDSNGDTMVSLLLRLKWNSFSFPSLLLLLQGQGQGQKTFVDANCC